jgi:hypothetical protein
MADKANKHGLSRHIPAQVALEIRKRSKFGCVICRAGIFEYEHIEIPFADATEHDPDYICCLCSSCHSKVTRKQYSKELVQNKYDAVRIADQNDVQRPFDGLDFHAGVVRFVIGGITYSNQLKSIIRYHGTDIISIVPNNADEAAGINAIFMDDTGQETLRIEGRVWSGSLDAWDTVVKGNRISVRKKKGIFSLRIRIEPPSSIVIEHLDMRVKDAHILASEHYYAVARCADGYDPYWFTAALRDIEAPLPGASAIEFMTPYEVEWRDQMCSNKGQRLSTDDGKTVCQTGLGVTFKPMGVIAASNCLNFKVYGLAYGGPRKISKVRSAIFSKKNTPENLKNLLSIIGERNL